MSTMICPHCNEGHLAISLIPKDVVAVMPCPSCHELAVLFRNKVIPLSRRIIEKGTREERSTHFAKVISEFLEAGLFSIRGLQGLGGTFDEAANNSSDSGTSSISEREVEDFVKIDLKSLDDARYFRENFG